MLNRYFIRPTTVDRIRASWIGEPIERYVEWLSEQKYAARNVFSRVPLLIRFGEFAKAAGVNSWPELPAHVDSFLEEWLRRRGREYSEIQRQALTRNLRNPTAHNTEASGTTSHTAGIIRRVYTQQMTSKVI